MGVVGEGGRRWWEGGYFNGIRGGQWVYGYGVLRGILGWYRIHQDMLGSKGGSGATRQSLSAVSTSKNTYYLVEWVASLPFGDIKVSQCF